MANIIKALSSGMVSKSVSGTLSSVGYSSGWWPWTVREPYAGAWQENVTWTRECVLAYHAVFACVSLIANDIAKLRMGMVQFKNGIWQSIPVGKYKVINNPNNYQNSIQFYESWILSKLIRGNTYVLKGRDKNGNVDRMYVLHPDLVTPMVSDEGEIFYSLSQDNINNIESSVIVPASEIIHDRFNCFFHPLIGLSPLFAAGLAAYSGLKIQENAANHFKNLSRPSGILTAPGSINDETAARIKTTWESNYGGSNYGKTAILGDDLQYKPISITPVESQMVEQLKLDAEIVCSAFHVPSYKVIGDAPSYDNVGALQQQYFDQCLQIHIESLETCLDDGLSLPDGIETRFDLDGLFRMDQKNHIETLSSAVKGGIMPPNVALKKQNLNPIEGGDTVYLQQQMYSLEALAKRDATDNPFNSSSNQPVQNNNTDSPEKQLGLLKAIMRIKKELNGVVYNV